MTQLSCLGISSSLSFWFAHGIALGGGCLWYTRLLAEWSRILATLFLSVPKDSGCFLSSRSSWKWLHQCQLHRWLPQAECLHCHTGTSARHTQWFLEDGMGAAHSNYCHDDPVGGEVSGMDKLNLLLMDGINMERCSLCGICIPSVLWHAV